MRQEYNHNNYPEFSYPVRDGRDLVTIADSGFFIGDIMKKENIEFKFCLECNKKYFRPYRYAYKLWDNRKYCSKDCYTKSRKGEISRNWKGGKKSIRGYIELYMPNHYHSDSAGYVKEHIYIMCEAIKRNLLKDEIIHHINGVRSDNNIDNLQVMNRSDHISLHMKGKKLSLETKNKLSKIRKLRNPIIQRKDNGQFKKGVIYASRNLVILIGHLGKDPETTYTPAGVAITKFSMATSDKYKDKEETQWHQIVTFNKLAEICGEYLKSGKQVYIEGKIKYRTWEKDGVKHYATEIHADSMVMLGGKE